VLRATFKLYSAKMVQVLENKLVELDVIPGENFLEGVRQLRRQLAERQAAPQNADQSASQNPDDKVQGETKKVEGVDSAREQVKDQGDEPGTEGQLEPAGTVPSSIQEIPEEEYNKMSPEEKDKAKSTGALIVDGTGKVLYGIGSTVGGVVKGVGDTAFNVVYDVGSGLGKIGSTAVGGLYGTAKAPFEGNEGKASTQPTTTEAGEKPQLPTSSEEK